MRTRKAQSQLEEILEYRRRTAVPEPPPRKRSFTDRVGAFIPFITILIILGTPAGVILKGCVEDGYFGPYVEKAWSHQYNVHYKGETYRITDYTLDYKTNLPKVIDQTVKDLKNGNPVPNTQEFRNFWESLPHYSTGLDSIDVIPAFPDSVWRLYDLDTSKPIRVFQ